MKKLTFKEVLERHPNTTSYDFIKHMKDHTIKLLDSTKNIKKRVLSVAYLATDNVFVYEDLKVNEIKTFLDLEDLGFASIVADLCELTKKAKYNILTNDDRIQVRNYILKVLTLNDIFKGDVNEPTNKKVL